MVVTREAGKNGKLKSALQKEGIIVLELPLVETSPGPEKYGTSAAGHIQAFDLAGNKPSKQTINSASCMQGPAGSPAEGISI